MWCGVVWCSLSKQTIEQLKLELDTHEPLQFVAGIHQSRVKEQLDEMIEALIVFKRIDGVELWVEAHGRPAQKWESLGGLDVVLEQLLQEHRSLKDWQQLPALNAEEGLEEVKRIGP